MTSGVAEPFIEALQSYYAPAAALILFAVFIFENKVLSKRIRSLFLYEVAVCITVIAATWADRCFSSMGTQYWKLRLFTTFLNFFVSPFSLLILNSIYRNRYKRKKITKILFYLPILCNSILCIASIFNGMVFEVTNQNIYHRGGLFLLPYAVSAAYMISLILFSWRQTQHDKKMETNFLTGVAVVIAVSCALEILLNRRYMLWSTNTVCAILYFMLLNIQKILYEPLTGAYSRISYAKELELIDRRDCCVIAMIDVNNLKTMNDNYGHEAGDQVICAVSSAIMQESVRRMNLYRIGGDEFVLLMRGTNVRAVQETLRRAEEKCHTADGHKVTFAYGIRFYMPTDDLQTVIGEADKQMYECKSQMKAALDETADYTEEE